MKKDIPFLPVEGVFLVVASNEENQWHVYLVNENPFALENVIINSRGYGEKDGAPQQTSVLRHMFPRVEAEEYITIELIDPSVFHLNNEYWISYFVEQQIYDKKFIFLPDSIVPENVSFIPQIGMKGILHR
ncbi:MAG: hypothetical protein MUE33_12330 [Cytophagaceae bacterium]|jgi:hypothetical protein|nr:hypothetical protein [Cytophagaceae bacterium]